ncbi:hypothetical protein AB0A94_34280 [Streptomyces sp. NPDC044984]|uniref:hypothetical protein n=1 Tax=Streptomyces sp. NPDC044984 TaxID=3154335 RepID=UPI0034069B7C
MVGGGRGLRGDLSGADAAEHAADGRSGAEETGAAHHGAPGKLLGRQFLVGDGQAEGRRDGVGFDDLVAGSVVVGMVVVVSVAAVGHLSFR